jgi:hypothetical protein
MLRLNAVRENPNKRWLLPGEMAQQLRNAKFAVILLISSKGRSTMTKLKFLSKGRTSVRGNHVAGAGATGGGRTGSGGVLPKPRCRVP